MRTLVAFLLGVAVTVGVAYVRDTSVPPNEKPLVNWDQVNGVTRNAIDAIRAEWNRLTNNK